jgi:hypothetical protein
MALLTEPHWRNNTCCWRARQQLGLPMLESKSIITTLSGENSRASTAKGCQQGGVFRLCCEAWMWMNFCGNLMTIVIYQTIGYAGDIAILINRIFSQTVSGILQTALGIVRQWCNSTIFSINTNDTVLVPFTRKRDILGPKKPALFS